MIPKMNTPIITGSADNDGGNAVICQVFTVGRCADAQPGCQENSGDTSTDRTENIGSNLPFGHIDAGKLDSLFISADGIDDPAEGSLFYNEPDNDDADHHDDAESGWRLKDGLCR